MDSEHRFNMIFVYLQPVIIGQLHQSSSKTVPAIEQWTRQSSASARTIFLRNRDSYSACPDASFLLGTASSRLYNFVRKELGIPFLRTSTMMQAEGCLGNHSFDRPEFGLTTGELISSIYQSIRTRGLYGPVMECLAQVEHAD